jgi:hypothetical protein
MNYRINLSISLIISIVFFLPSIAFSQQILITEVMYDLDGTDSPNEFVEIFNPSETDSLNMDGWTIRDRSSTDALIDSGFGLKMDLHWNVYGITWETIHRIGLQWFDSYLLFLKVK